MPHKGRREETDVSIVSGTALRGPHGEIAEYIDGDADWFGLPAVHIRRMAGIEVTVASAIGRTWIPVPGRVVVHEHQTGRWNTPVERRLSLAEEVRRIIEIEASK